MTDLTALSTLQKDRERIVLDHMADENTQAFDKVLTTFPHPRYEIVPTGQIIDGLEAVSAYYARTRATFPDQRNELISLRHVDDAVIVEFWLRGTLAGFAADDEGGKFACRMTAFFIFQEATLVCERVYFDALTMVKQLIGQLRWWQPGSWLRAVRVLRLLKQESTGTQTTS
jgi:hypothetical protein